MNKQSLLPERVLLFNEAMRYYGMKEIPGSVLNNPIIVSMFHSIGHQQIKDDETSWCSCFVNFVSQEVGVESSGALDARSWLKVGESTTKPKMGDIVVFWRESQVSWKGHVAIYVNEDEDHVYCLGGNQSNMVCIAAYAKDRVLDYRTLKFTSHE